MFRRSGDELDANVLRNHVGDVNFRNDRRLRIETRCQQVWRDAAAIIGRDDTNPAKTQEPIALFDRKCGGIPQA